MTREQRARVILGPLKIWAGLMVLLALTFGYAYLPHGPAKTEVSLAIAATKALLIAAFFMQLREAAGIVRMAAIAGAAWTSLLYMIAFADYLTR